VTVPRTEEWADERLRLGDSSTFGLLDVDPDGAALKLDRYLWSFPRLLAVEKNGDPVHAAPTALRSIGFTVVRHKKALETQARMDRQHALKGSIAQGTPELLDTEDVTQGLRVEVWDDTAKAWFSLHTRRITAEALNHGPVVNDLPEEGFIQGTTATETPDVADSPVHVHESVFGWEGWSLSAPRPGKRIRHENGDEVVEDADANPDPLTPLIVMNRVEPGTLPRLRYGRNYAFRAWAVDLAGNSRPHRIGSLPSPQGPSVSAVKTVLATRRTLVEPGTSLLTTLRAETEASLVARRTAAMNPEYREISPEEFSLLTHPEADRVVRSRLRSRRLDSRTGAVAPAARVDRATLVSRAFAAAIEDPAQPFVAESAILDPTSIARAVAGRRRIRPELIQEILKTITPLRPFLRWDPVQPPAIVSRHAYSAGESLRQLVIRSGVVQDLETLEITVVGPEDYANAQASLGYRATSERHVAPPKTSQSEAELHGAFDEAIGSTEPDDHRKLLAVALRESGNLFDVDVPRLDNPSVRDPQPGIALAHDPDVPPSTFKTLPLPLGEMPATGQYVVHDTDQLRLPYLPDAGANGISLVFQDAGRDRQLIFPFGTEGFTVVYNGEWPEREPFRFVLTGSDVLDGRLDGNVLSVALPAGDVQRFRLASSLRREDLDLFGLWRLLPRALRQNEDVIEAAKDGWLWALTPFDDVTLVHAVPRPLEAPRPTRILAVRKAQGATDAVLFGGVDIHGPSTEQLTAEAKWTDPVDDLSLPAPEDQEVTGVGFTTIIREEEDLAVLYGADQDTRVVVPGAGPVWLHSAIHRFGDTKHRNVRYRFRAATRFREYFDADALTPALPSSNDPSAPVDDGQSVVGPEFVVSVPSSARPAAPVVHSVLPLFRWDEGTEPEQPVAVRRRRRAGVRVYLERPWYSSGENELLGVILAPGGNDEGLSVPVSQWGSDPVWLSAPVLNRAMTLQLDSLLRTTGLDDRPGDAQPVVAPATLPLAAVAGSPMVIVLGYKPQYSVERQKWYVDIAIDQTSRFWPFVRLAICRYQPDSIANCHLSAPVQCDFVQLTPERTTSVSRTDIRHARVVVSGPVGVRTPPPGHRRATSFPTDAAALADWVSMNRKVVARLQRVDPSIPTDLGWKTVDAVELEVRGHGLNLFEAAWVGELEAPEDIPLQRPGEQSEWRITIEEWERLPGDPEDLGAVGLVPPPPEWEQRLVYADEVPL
jgi:hypothetical protein